VLAYTGYISAEWLGNPARDVPPWRDTGVVVRGPAVAAINGGEIVVKLDRLSNSMDTRCDYAR